MNFSFKSIHFRLTFWYMLVLMIVLLTFSTLVYFSLAHSLYSTIDDSIQAQAEWIADILSVMEEEVDIDEFKADLSEHGYGKEKDQYVQIRQGNGEVIYKSEQLSHVIQSSEESLQRALINESYLETVADPFYGNMRIVTLPMEDEGKLIYFVQVVASFKQTHRILHRLLFILLSSGIIALSASVIGGRFLAQKALKPVDDIIETTKKIEAENLGQRLDVPPTKDELSRLASTLNEMIDRLEHSFQQIRQFTADASHELRTPLTVMRGQSEVTLKRDRSAEEYRQVLESNLEEMEWMSRIIENLLTLSRTDAGEIQLQINSVQLEQLLNGIYEECRLLASAKGIEVFIDKIQDVTIFGDEMRLWQMLLNLIDNAVKYTPDGGQIQLSLEAYSEFAKLQIKDTGIGISQEDLPHIFNRFFRVDKVRSREIGGSGLGLSIVQWIVNAHHGRIEVTSKLGEGSCFTVMLPLKNK